ncbi:MAG: protein translocase subunit SecD [Ardenticatenaceae bacterium]|nr:protein translocase subunit SecD [Ardenticatenaceae bacterium]
MQSRTVVMLGLILLLAVTAIWLALPNNPGIHVNLGPLKINRDVVFRRGLDLQGGLQVVLAADLPSGQAPDKDAMQAAKAIIERRVNGLGVSEPLIQQVGNDRIVVELPGLKDPDQAIATFGETGLLEFIDAGNTPLQEGTKVVTDFGAQAPVTDTATTKVYHTVLTGADLKSADVGFESNTSQPQIAFEFKSGQPAQTLAQFTRDNVGRYLAITLDKQVISSPVIQSQIPDGRGVINGRFTLEEAQALVIQLKYGALPVPLKVIENRTVGATLGEDSVHRSFLAGAIGIAVVGLFMILYYRLPGVLAVGALAVYMAVVLSLFKLIPVTLTLAGIAGFVLSVGMAVDANVLIFERMKEELRDGKALPAAVRAGFERAWPSIRDSNASTLITCAILFWFGATFGASIVKGFALTLALGVLISLFTAITVTRTFLHAVMRLDATKNHWWFGV